MLAITEIPPQKPALLTRQETAPAIRISVRTYAEPQTVVVVATGTTIAGQPFGSSGTGITRAGAIRDLLRWSRYCRKGAPIWKEYRAAHPYD